MTFDTRATSPLDGLGSGAGVLSAVQPERLSIVHGDEPSVPADAVLSLAPGRWLVVHERDDGSTSRQPGRGDDEPDGGSSGPAWSDGQRVVQVDQGFVRIRISGDEARALLATGISIDLHPDVFVAGDDAVTAYRGILVVLHAVDADTLDLYTPRSYARSLWEALEDAALGVA